MQNQENGWKRYTEENTPEGELTMSVICKVLTRNDITDIPSGQITKKGVKRFVEDLEVGLNNLSSEGWRLAGCCGAGNRYFIFIREDQKQP
jgi:hypothetical protein